MLVAFQVYSWLVGGFRASSDFLLILRWIPADTVHLVRYCKAVSVLENLALVAELRLVLSLIVANHDHPRIARVSTLLPRGCLLTPVQRATILVYKLASVLVLISWLV